MDATEVRTPPTVLGRLLDWLAHFERAIEMRPVDDLELRVAELERRLDRSLADAPARTASNRRAES